VNTTSCTSMHRRTLALMHRLSNRGMNIMDAHALVHSNEAKVPARPRCTNSCSSPPWSRPRGTTTALSCTHAWSMSWSGHICYTAHRPHRAQARGAQDSITLD
jgi:hypothetical protein